MHHDTTLNTGGFDVRLLRRRAERHHGNGDDANIVDPCVCFSFFESHLCTVIHHGNVISTRLNGLSQNRSMYALD